LRPRSVSTAHRSMLPWAWIRHVPMLPRLSAPSRRAGRFAPRANPRGVPGPEQSWGRQSVSALSGSFASDARSPCPKAGVRRSLSEESERDRSRVAPAHSEESASAALPLAPASRRTLRRAPPPDPEGIAVEGRAARSPEGDFTAHGSGEPQQAGGPVSGQTVIVFIENRPV